MGSTRSHPLPPGIFVEMNPSPDEFDNEIRRLHERIKELKSQKVTREEDDPDVREMVEDDED